MNKYLFITSFGTGLGYPKPDLSVGKVGVLLYSARLEQG